jgi:hypothetical protein
MPDVFFYGLFMDRALLLAKGVLPTNERAARLDGYSLRIGQRATLVPTANSLVYGIVMALSQDELDALYTEPSVRDYRPESVVAVFADNTSGPVLCLILPQSAAPEEHNKAYADKLRALAEKLGLPKDYVMSIR